MVYVVRMATVGRDLLSLLITRREMINMTFSRNNKQGARIVSSHQGRPGRGGLVTSRYSTSFRLSAQMF